MSRSVSNSGNKTERFEARVSLEQKELFQLAASLSGVSLTDFVVSHLINASKRIVKEHDILALSREDTRIFVDALLEPAQPNKNLQQAYSRYKENIEND